MNFKKTLLSSFAVVALAVSIATPVVVAQEASQTLTSNVSEQGTLTYGFTGLANPISFSASVDTHVSSDVGPVHRGFVFNDTRAYSDGFDLQISATDFVSGDYWIDNANLKIGKRAPQPGSTDFCTLNDTQAPVGGNGFQNVTVLGTHVPTTTPLSGPVSVISASSGRGCGVADLGVSYFLHVPAGTFTDGGNAQYTSTLTLTNMAAVGE